MQFDVAADAYDRYMGAWSRQLSPGLVAFAGIRSGQRVLDVGCGPGALTAQLLEAVGDGSVSAVDPSESFVAAARARHPGVDVRQAAAEALPFPDRSFDAALAQLVIHFMTDPVAGIHEMARVTRRGGVVAACVWDFGGDRGPLGPFWEAARGTDPSVVDESHLAGTREGHLAELFESAGLADVQQGDLSASRKYADFADWWTPFTQGVGPGGAYVAGLDGARQRALRERCRSMLPDGPIFLTAHAWVARGTA